MTLFSKRPRLIIIAVAVIIIAAIGWLILSQSTSKTLAISFAGSEPGHGDAVGVWITNTTGQTVILQSFRIQTARDGNWKTEPENQTPVFGEAKTPLSYVSPVKLVPGEYQKNFVIPPTNEVWRAELA